VGVVGGGEHGAALLVDLGGGAVVDVGGGVQAQAGVAMFVVVPGEKDLAVLPGGFDRGEPTGKSGRYFSVLNWASLKGLSSETCGGLCDWVTPRSASRNATGLEVIELPRSAWMVNWSRLMPCLVQVWRISTSASAADSRVATIQPTVYRE
jgi:hypothetical protein